MKPHKRRLPLLEVVNRQRTWRFKKETLLAFSHAALEAVLLHPEGPGGSLLPDADEIVIAVLSDRGIAKVHRNFMGIRGPTDVITFEHGEIVIGAGTAAQQAVAHGTSPAREVALYILHGLLHLHGYEDGTRAAREDMESLQACIMDSLSHLTRAE